MTGRLAIIGIGLIGGSLARALKEAGWVQEIVGYARHPASLEKALALDVIDEAVVLPEDAVEGADLVVIATPVGVIPEVMQAIAPALSPETVITDVGSVKGSVVQWAAEHLPAHESRFVPGHPIAGTEQSGVEASFAELFQQHRVVLTPTPVTGVDALQLVAEMWEATGAEVVEMDPASHDEVFAACSHVPHVLAYALVDSLVRRDDHREIFHFAAGGFRDFTRIASSNPEMWRDICMANRDAIVQVLSQFAIDLDDLITAMQASNGAQLLKTFERAKHARDTYMINNKPGWSDSE